MAEPPTTRARKVGQPIGGGRPGFACIKRNMSKETAVGLRRSGTVAMTAAVAMLVASCSAPVQAPPAAAPAPGSEPGVSTFSQAQIDQMLAPIALYPDSMLSQVLMASTYPADIADAAA